MGHTRTVPPEDDPNEKSPPPREEALPPLEPGRPMTREESVERMYRRFDKTFEALAK